MFCKHIQSKRRLRRTSQPTPSVIFIFRTSKFHVSLLLITSFLVLVAIPNLIDSLLRLNDKQPGYALLLYIGVSNSLSDTVDFVIYVLMYKPPRTLLLAKVATVRRWFDSKLHGMSNDGGGGGGDHCVVMRLRNSHVITTSSSNNIHLSIYSTWQTEAVNLTLYSTTTPVDISEETHRSLLTFT